MNINDESAPGTPPETVILDAIAPETVVVRPPSPDEVIVTDTALLDLPQPDSQNAECRSSVPVEDEFSEAEIAPPDYEPPPSSPVPEPASTAAPNRFLGMEETSALERCERRIGFIFKDKVLLRSALTHASGADHRLASNERLEFLGDAILGYVVCELLFKRYPKYLEGDLTKIKSVVVSRQTCAKVSEAIGLQEFLIVGKGMASADSVPPSLLADVFESLIAAIYLDGGECSVRRFIEEYIAPEIDLAAAGELGGNYKSHLQQLAQREFGNTPVYVLVDERGPDHRKSFKMAAQVGSRRFPAAWGRNKKEAEQRAACNALSEVKGEALPFPSD